VESDLLLRRVEHTAIGICLAMAAVAWVLTRQVGAAGAVVAGGILIGTSYRLIKSGVSELVAAAPPKDRADARARGVRIVLKVAGRYALLGFAAYVMIARLRLHPLGLLAGASSIVAAVTVEAVRLLVKKA
jgi:hypothetical protein